MSIASDDLINIFGAGGITVCLYEPNGDFSLTFYVDKKNIQILESSVNDFRDNRYRSFCEGVDIAFEDGDLCLPLSTDRTKIFGFIVLHGSGQEEEGDLSDVELLVLQKFSEVLHSEAIGSIALSYYSTVVKIADLRVEYSSGHHTTVAVDGVNFNICENEFTLILGASGCGKTSLLNAIGTMLTPKSGEIIYNNNDITQFSNAEATRYRRETVGFVFQQYNLISDLTAKENIEVSASLAEDPFSPEEVLEMVGLADKARNYPSQMSGGEQQRVCIARALVKRPKLLLCDEPTGALDTKNAIQVMTILQDLVKKSNVPVVMITHNDDFAALADHYVLMSNGKIVEEYRQPFAVEAKNLVIR